MNATVANDPARPAAASSDEMRGVADHPDEQRRRKERDDRRQFLAGPDQAEEPLGLAEIEEPSRQRPSSPARRD